MIKYYCIAIFSGMLSSFSQILLKKSAQKEKKSIIQEYVNPYVIGGYAITAICMVLTIIAYRGMPFKYGAVLESLTYLYIMVLSKLLLGEKLTKKKIVGNLIIVVGVIIFSLGR
ncbi:MAG: EamA family transporter [Eubacteriales bacterium]|nr:EamA family transporter [Eubacteriales bacterium]